MLLRLARPAKPHQRTEQQFVRLALEWIHLQPLLEDHDLLILVLSKALDDFAQHGGVTCAQAATLGAEPLGEQRTVVQVESFQELAAEQARAPAQRLQSGFT